MARRPRSRQLRAAPTAAPARVGVGGCGNGRRANCAAGMFTFESFASLLFALTPLDCSGAATAGGVAYWGCGRGSAQRWRRRARRLALRAPYGRIYWLPTVAPHRSGSRQRATRFACIGGDGLAGSQYGLPTVASTGSLRSHPIDPAARLHWQRRARRLAIRSPYGRIPSIQRATRFACIDGDWLAGSQYGLPTVAFHRSGRALALAATGSQARNTGW